MSASYPGDVTREEEIASPAYSRPHLVILGAGASRAAFPYGDAQGRKLPLMNDLVEVVGLEDILQEARIDWRTKNFEVLYGELAELHGYEELVGRLESKVSSYFESLSLPDSPTLYDHLLLSLRPKDRIATFNWDPFLYDAAQRNRSTPLPGILYLHGNTRVGYCLQDKRKGLRGRACSACGEQFVDSKLLFPVAKKNYADDPFISAEWAALRGLLGDAFALTIFGYGAPTSDAEAVSLMKEAWGEVEDRQFEEIEIIDIRTDQELRDTWSPFIHTHHYQVHPDFYSSIAGLHPRRSIEALYKTLLDARFTDTNPILREGSLVDLWEWIGPLLDAEDALAASDTGDAVEQG